MSNSNPYNAVEKPVRKNNITVKSVFVASKIATLCLFAVRAILILCRGLLLVPNSNEDSYVSAV